MPNPSTLAAGDDAGSPIPSLAPEWLIADAANLLLDGWDGKPASGSLTSARGLLDEVSEHDLTPSAVRALGRLEGYLDAQSEGSPCDLDEVRPLVNALLHEVQS